MGCDAGTRVYVALQISKNSILQNDGEKQLKKRGRREIAPSPRLDTTPRIFSASFAPGPINHRVGRSFGCCTKSETKALRVSNMVVIAAGIGRAPGPLLHQ
jgi:hypothetical protein